MCHISTPTALPLERPQRVDSEELKSLPYAEQEVRLSKAEVETLTAAAKRRRLTLNTLAQGAWAILLRQCTGDGEVLFGATVSPDGATVYSTEELPQGQIWLELEADLSDSAPFKVVTNP